MAPEPLMAPSLAPEPSMAPAMAPEPPGAKENLAHNRRPEPGGWSQPFDSWVRCPGAPRCGTVGATVRTCAHRAANPTVEPLGPPCARRAVRWGPLYGHARIGRKPNSPTVRVGEKGAYSGSPPLAHKTGGEPPNMDHVPWEKCLPFRRSRAESRNPFSNR